MDVPLEASSAVYLCIDEGSFNLTNTIDHVLSKGGFIISNVIIFYLNLNNNLSKVNLYIHVCAYLIPISTSSERNIPILDDLGEQYFFFLSFTNLTLSFVVC